MMDAVLDHETLQARVNADAALVRRGRWVTLDFILGVGEDDFIISVGAGQITAITPRRLQTKSGVFAIRAPAEHWRLHWQAVPPRDYHDIFAMLAKGLVTIDGTLTPLMQNLQYFKDVIACLRQKNGAADGR